MHMQVHARIRPRSTEASAPQVLSFKYVRVYKAMIQAVTCASTKTNVQKIQSIGIGAVKPNSYSVSVSVSTTMLYIAYGHATLVHAAALIIALQHTPLLSNVSV